MAWVLSFMTTAHGALTFEWTPPTNYVPNGYIIFHSTVSGAYSEAWNAGNGTNYTLNVQLPFGVNYFVITDYLVENNGVLEMSSWSNEVVVTNNAMFDLSMVVLTTTNFGNWYPYSTTHIVFPNDNISSRYFRSGNLDLTITNQLTPSPNP